VALKISSASTVLINCLVFMVLIGIICRFKITRAALPGKL
jgi:hypothetical protein